MVDVGSVSCVFFLLSLLVLASVSLGLQSTPDQRDVGSVGRRGWTDGVETGSRRLRHRGRLVVFVSPEIRRRDTQCEDFGSADLQVPTVLASV